MAAPTTVTVEAKLEAPPTLKVEARLTAPAMVVVPPIFTLPLTDTSSLNVPAPTTVTVD